MNCWSHTGQIIVPQKCIDAVEANTTDNTDAVQVRMYVEHTFCPELTSTS